VVVERLNKERIRDYRSLPILSVGFFFSHVCPDSQRCLTLPEARDSVKEALRAGTGDQ